MAGYQHRQQIRLGFCCMPAMAEQLEAVAKERQLPLTEILRQAVTEYLKQDPTV